MSQSLPARRGQLARGLPARQPGLRNTLLGRASLAAMLAASASPRALAAGGNLSLPQALASASAAAARVSGNTASLNAGSQAAIGMASLQTAARRVRSLQQALALRQATGAAPGAAVPNGLAAGGLVPASGYDKSGSGVWIGVNAASPVQQSTAGGTTTVTVNQAQPQAILNWSSFNVGAHTHLVFNQSAGGSAASSWSVLNRIESTTTSPSEIFGAISAPGQVLVLNPNGVLFGAGAQVSLHSLVAGAISMADSQFLTTGIYGKFTGTATSSVVVQAGASIETPAPASAETGGGSVLLLAGSVENDGTIETPSGQTVLAAGTGFLLRTGYSVAANTTVTPGSCPSESACSTVLGTEIQTTGKGSATNTGFVASTTGDITMDAETVIQAGVLYSTTSVARRGTIHLLANTSDRASAVTLAPGSVTLIEPDASSPMADLSQRNDTAQTAYGDTDLLNDQAPLTDHPDRSRVEIAAGGTVNFADGSLVLANAGQVAVSAAAPAGAKYSNGQIFVASGATIDVSGLNDVILPMSSNIVQVNIQGFQLRDAPVNRDAGKLFNDTISLDARQLIYVAPSAVDSSAREYTAGGLLEVSGELSQVEQSIQQWSTIGGTVMLQSDAVVAQPGAVVNIAGGSIQYQAGSIPQTYLIGPSGILYNANVAPANLRYSGIYGGFTVDHARWNISQTYSNSLTTPAGLLEPAYLEGRDAGTLTLVAPTAIFDAAINAGVQTGTLQTVSHASVAAGTDPVTIGQSVAPLAGALVFADTPYPDAISLAGLPTSVTITAGTPGTAASLSAGGALPAGSKDTAVFGAGQLDGLGALTIETGAPSTIGTVARELGAIDVAGAVTLAPGGTLTLAAPDVTLSAPVVARSGQVLIETENPLPGAGAGTLTPYSATARGTIALAAGASIDTRGEWTNLVLDPAETYGAAFVNGGNVALISSGALLLASGTSIDASSGAIARQGSVGGGTGGNITLVADDPAIGIANKAGKPVPDAPVALGASLTSIGFSSGGTVSITAPSILIGNDAVPLSDLQVALGPQFFQSGFADYILNGFAAPVAGSTALAQGVVVMPDTTVTVQEPVWQATPGALLSPSGTDPSVPLQAVLFPEFMLNPATNGFQRRAGASLTLESDFVSVTGTVLAQSGGGVGIGAGALVSVDPGQSVTVQSAAQITVDGSISAPSGTISIQNPAPVLGVDPAAAAKTSIWIGSASVLNADGMAVTGTDNLGFTVGEVFAGGTILVGAPASVNSISIESSSTAGAYVFVRPGATLTANGSAAALDLAAGTASTTGQKAGHLPGGTLTEVGSAGGTIAFSSAFGIYLDGAMTAAAGAPGVSAGELAVRLEDPGYASARNPKWAYAPHEIIVSQATTPSVLPDDLAPGDSSFATLGANGQAAVSAQQVSAGGFGSLLLLARDQIVFNGDVTLAAAQSIELADFSSAASGRTGTVTISAPYVVLAAAPQPNYSGASASPLLTYGGNGATASNGGEPFSQHAPCFAEGGACSGASLTVNAQLIDIAGTALADVAMNGAYAVFSGQSTAATLNSYGFGSVSLLSGGDIRFVPAQDEQQNGASANRPGLYDVNLVTEGDLTLDAQRIYPATGVDAVIEAGVNFFRQADRDQHKLAADQLFYGGTLTIGNDGVSGPAAPMSVFGNLNLTAATIQQDGNLFAPLGQIALGAIQATGYAQVLSVTLGAGGTISVSAAGLTVPFGGTTDGTSYSYDATQIAFAAASLGGITFQTPFISFRAPSTTVQAGAVLDVEGGGTLTGGTGELAVSLAGTTTLQSQGFISGRGGSVDTLVTPFLQFNSKALTATQPTLAQDPVYAIVPGYADGYAPVTSLEVAGVTASGAAVSYYGSLPAVGEQVTIGAGTPGLPAGTYTLLPSTYALLPGAFRVQFGGAAVAGSTTAIAGSTVSLGNGTYETTGTVSDALSGVGGVTPGLVYLTPAAAVRDYAQYDEESYAQYAVANAALFGNPRPFLPEDAGNILVSLELLAAQKNQVVAAKGSGFTFDGTALTASDGGYSAALDVESGNASGLEVIGGADQVAKGDDAIAAAAIDALHAPILFLGDTFSTPINSISQPQNGAATVLVAGDVRLAASAMFLIGSQSVTVDAGAVLTTLGGTVSLPDSSTGVLFEPAGSAILALANGNFVFPAIDTGTAQITLGACSLAAGCGSAGTTLVSGGVLALLTGGKINIGQNVVFGARDLVIDTSTLTIGDAPAAGTLAATGTLSATGSSTVSNGATLSQATLDALIEGNPAAGIPALQTLSLIAGQSIDFFAGAALDTVNPQTGQSALTELDITTPAIYGHNDATAGVGSDAAIITTGTLVWNGTGTLAASPVAPGGFGDGTGTLSVQAGTIVIGFPALSQPQNTLTLGHSVAGFGTVVLAASGEFTANNHAALEVYQCLASTCGSSTGSASATASGGALVIDTPLVTTASGAQLAITAGGAVTLQNSFGQSSAGTAQASASSLGGEIDITGAGIALDTAIVLHSGAVSLIADAPAAAAASSGTSTAASVPTGGDITLGTLATIDVSGPALSFFGQTRGSFGGNVTLVSQSGNIVQSAGSVIDIAAADGNAGTLSATARGAAAPMTETAGGTATAVAANTGTVTLGGTVEGSAPAGDDAGSIAVTAYSLGGDAAFAALNASLDAAGVSFARGFEQTGPGNLSVGNLTAQHVAIAVDAGDLAVTGTINAGGSNPGTIDLAAGGNLTIAGGAVLNVAETALHTDQLGAPILAENTPHIELQVASNGAAVAPGVLTIASGATIDMAGPGGLSLGVVELDVPRTVAGASAGAAGTYSAGIEATGSIAITGAAEIDVNAFRTYVAGTSTANAATVAPGGTITQATLDDINVNSLAYMSGGNGPAGVVQNGALTAPLAAQLSGLTDAYASVLHVRPGVEIDSAAGGDLTVNGKIDFYDYRYASINPSVAQPSASAVGQGEPGVLWLRAANDLTIHGDLSDGFGPPPTVTLFHNYTYRHLEALAPLLAAGDLSWSFRLVGGANLDGADSRATEAASQGNDSAAAGGGDLTLSYLRYTPQNTPGDLELFVDVVRTGTGYLDLYAGGNFSEGSPYGVYTAGTAAAAAPQVSGENFTAGGGNVTIDAGGNVSGFNAAIVYDPNNPVSGLPSNTNDVNLWLQHTGNAWWTSFGSLSRNYFYGFEGIATFGGGNVSVTAGGNAGIVSGKVVDNAVAAGDGLDIAIGTSGYENQATGSVTVLGGGDISLQTGGAINPGVNSFANNPFVQGALQDYQLGAITDLRGNVFVKAASIGQVSLTYQALTGDPRPVNPYVSETYQASGGPILIMGDARAVIDTRGDLVLQDVADAGGLKFSFYEPQTSVQLFSAGGNLVPATIGDVALNADATFAINPLNSSESFYYAPILDAVAASGNIYMSFGQTNGGIELAPSPDGALNLLAALSIFDGGPSNVAGSTPIRIEESGAASDPASELPGLLFPVQFEKLKISTEIAETASGTLHAGNPDPARFYAVAGDVVGLLTGAVNINGSKVSYAGASPVQIIAGNDIVSTGGVSDSINGTLDAAAPSPDFFLNSGPTDLSLLQAGKDIIYANVDVAGPGTLMVSAGGNVYQGDEGILLSLGEIGAALTPLTRESGAAITVLAGLNGGYAPAGFANLYLNPANLANPTAPLQQQTGKVERTYQTQLLGWLQARGYTGDAAGALAYFLALPVAEQTAFLLTVYYAELNQAGLDYNNADSRFYHSYLEGQEAIKALFPNTDATGKAAAGGGALTLFSGQSGGFDYDSAIRTENGGLITTVVPYGATTLGNYGVVPQATAGILTQGSGGIDMYSYGSVILGQSRVLTTLGGDVLIWMSSDGEINAGRGSKTTSITPPPNVSYDAYGNVFLSPTVPSSGAGIGALAPIAGVPAGNVNLIAPFGTIDAGEAGVRASGNINVAALTVVNSANLSSGGKTTGVPTVSGPSTAAVAAAASASASSQAASQQVQAPKPQAAEPSVIEVNVSVSNGTSPDAERRKARQGKA